MQCRQQLEGSDNRKKLSSLSVIGNNRDHKATAIFNNINCN